MFVRTCRCPGLTPPSDGSREDELEGEGQRVLSLPISGFAFARKKGNMCRDGTGRGVGTFGFAADNVAGVSTKQVLLSLGH